MIPQAKMNNMKRLKKKRNSWREALQTMHTIRFIEADIRCAEVAAWCQAN